MKGRKPIPQHIKVLSGTNRPCRDTPDAPEFDLVHEFPEAPRHLDIDGASMWNSLGPQLVASKVLQTVDLYSLEQLCVAWQCFRKKTKAGMEATAAENQALKSLLAEFGMTPASRRRVVAGDTAKKGNKFAKYADG